MISILLLILKIIGIILLSVLGVALFLILLVLFVPVRYRFTIDLSEEENNKYKIEGVVTYLLHILNLHLNLPSEDKFYVRITLFRIYPRKKKQDDNEIESSYIKDVKKVKNYEGKVTEQSIETKEVTVDKAEETKEVIVDKAEDNIIVSESASKLDDEDKYLNITQKDEAIYEDKNYSESTSTDNLDVDESTSKSNKKDLTDLFFGLFDFVEKIKEKITRVFDRIKLTVSRLYDRIIDIKENTEYYIDIINSKDFKKAFGLCKKEIGRILKTILPRKVKGYIRYGSGEPDMTAKVFGLYVLLRRFLGRHFSFEPNLQEKELNGHIVISGHICMISILIVGIKLFFNRNIRRLIKMLKKENKDGR